MPLAIFLNLLSPNCKRIQLSVSLMRRSIVVEVHLKNMVKILTTKIFPRSI